MNRGEIEIAVTDLESKYQEIEKEANDKQFFIKIAHYGKYLLENKIASQVLLPLYKEAAEDSRPYVEAWKKFIKKWKVLARDILDKAEKAGIKDDPNDHFSRDLAELTHQLKNPSINIYLDDIDHYYTPYRELLWKVQKKGKLNYLIPKHYKSKDDLTPNLGKEHAEAGYKWKTFEVSRQAQVWWAHYQITKLAVGVLGLKYQDQYFNIGSLIDDFYRYEFNEIAKGNTPNQPMFLKRDRYKEWITRLHNYLIPRIRFFELSGKAGSEPPMDTRLYFYSENGLAEYKGAKWLFRGKGNAFLTTLNENKNTPYSVEDIKNSCNKLISNPKIQFRTEKDIDDTLRLIRQDLKVGKGEYFPILKRGKNWRWDQK